MKVFYNNIPYEKLTIEMNISLFGYLKAAYESIKNIPCDNDSQGFEVYENIKEQRAEAMFSLEIPEYLKEEAKEKMRKDGVPTIME